MKPTASHRPTPAVPGIRQNTSAPPAPPHNCPDEDKIPHKSWINITAEVHVEFAREYKGKGPVLYPVSIEPAEKPEDELVYFS